MPRALGPCLAPLLAGLLAAQERGAFVLFVFDPSGTHLADAAGEFRGEPPAYLPALRGIVDAGLHGSRTVVRSKSDAKGVLQVAPAPDAPDVRAIAGIVSTASRLGAIVGRLHAGRADTLRLLPMAAVTADDGKQAFTLWARALLPTGETVELPPQQGSCAYLPQGTYEVWAKGTAGWIWQRLPVQSGQTLTLSFVGAVRALHTPPSTRLHPAARPEVDLLAGGRDVALLGQASRAPLVAFVDGFSAGEQLLPDQAPDGPLAWPPHVEAASPTSTIRLLGGSDECAAAATLVGLSHTSADTWQVFAISRPNDRRFAVPAPPRGDAWLLLLAPEYAAVAVEWSLAGAPESLTLQRGVPLVVRARDEAGLPITDLAVDYVPERMEPATVAGHSDARGVARLGPVSGPGMLRVSDVRFANQTIELDKIPTDGAAVTVVAGSSLRGVAKWADGKTAAGVVVTLRDPTGMLRPAQRAVVSGDDGSFAFGGLGERRILVLFAATQRQGRTWSGKLDRLIAGGEDVELILCDEDPVLQRPAGH